MSLCHLQVPQCYTRGSEVLFLPNISAEIKTSSCSSNQAVFSDLRGSFLTFIEPLHKGKHSLSSFWGSGISDTVHKTNRDSPTHSFAFTVWHPRTVTALVDLEEQYCQCVLADTVVSLEAHWLPFPHGKKWGNSTMWSIRWGFQISWCPLLCLFSILRPEAVQVSWILSLSNSRLIKQAGSRQSRFFSSKMQGCSPNHKNSLQRLPGTMPVLIPLAWRATSKNSTTERSCDAKVIS